MAWNFLMKNRADTRVAKNNTINVINNNTEALKLISVALDELKNVVKELEKRITKLENKQK